MSAGGCLKACWHTWSPRYVCNVRVHCVSVIIYLFAVGGLALLVWQQERHLACKKYGGVEEVGTG